MEICISEYNEKKIVVLLDNEMKIVKPVYAPFPQEHLAKGIPVLWLINNDSVTPPWGKVARIKV